MAINPPSDIVLGTLLAADPHKYRVAAERLRLLTAEVAARAGTAPSAPTGAGAASRSSAPPVSLGTAAPAPRARGPNDAFGQLEAFVLQTFIQDMLPKNAENVFGKGTAGEVWKSMLAEKLANEMAQSGQVGLAKRLAEGAKRAGSSLEMVQLAPRPVPSLMTILPYLGESGARVPLAGEAVRPDPLTIEDRS